MRRMIALLLVLSSGCAAVRQSDTSSTKTLSVLKSMEEESADIPYRRGSALCCPPERHPAAGCLFGDCDRERYAPRLIESNECCNDLEHWINPRLNCQKICLWERIVGRRRSHHFNPFQLLVAGCCECGSIRYSNPRTECDDEQTISSAIIYFSVSDPCKVDGLRIKNDDIVAFDGQRFARLFHGADVGLTDLEIDGFAILSASQFLFSFSKPFTIDDEHPVPGLVGEIDDSDILLFTVASLGEITRGTFSVYLNGKSAGLDNDEEDIDAISIDAEGRILISTVGNTKLPTLDGKEINVRDEDVVAVIRNDVDEEYVFEMVLDNSDIGLDEYGTDLDALGVSADNQLLISMRDTGEGSQKVAPGRGGEVLQLNIEKFGASTRGTIIDKFYVAGRMIGLNESDISSLEIGPVIATLKPENSPPNSEKSRENH